MKRKFLLTTVSWVFIQLLTASNALATITPATSDSPGLIAAVNSAATAGGGPSNAVIFNGLMGGNITLASSVNYINSALPVIIDGTLASSSLQIIGTSNNGLLPGGSTGGLKVISADLLGMTLGISAGKTLEIMDNRSTNVTMTSIVAGAGSLAFTGTNSTPVSSVNTFTGGLVVGSATAGAPATGTITLTGNNTFSGGITVNSGTLKSAPGATSTASLGANTNSVTIGSGATLEVSAATAATPPTNGALVNNGTVKLDDSSSATSIWGVGNISGTGSIYVGTNNTFTLNPTMASTYSGNFTGAGTVAHTGAVTLSLLPTTGVNQVGGFNVTSTGTLLGNTNSLSGFLTSATGTTASIIQFDQAFNGTFSGIFAGTSSNGNAMIRKTGSGVVTLTGDSSGGNFGGILEVDAGGIMLGSASAKLPTAVKLNLLNPGTFLDVGAANSVFGGFNSTNGVGVGTIKLSTNTGSLTHNSTSSNSFSGTITGPGNFINAGSGTLTLAGTNPNFVGGTLTIGAGSVVGNTTNIGGNVVFNTGSSGNLNFTQDTNGTFAGSIVGTTSGTGLVKNGAGNITLSGNVSGYTGPTVVNSGILTLASNYASNISGAGSTIFNSGTSGTTYSGTTINTIAKKIGTGTLTISNTQTGTSPIEVAQGTLMTSAALTNPVTIDSGSKVTAGAALSTVTNNGFLSLAPSTSGTPTNISVTNYTGNANSSLFLRLGAGSGGVSEYLTVSGTSLFNAGSNLILYPASGQTYTVGNSFQIIRGGTVTNLNNLQVYSGGANQSSYTLAVSGTNVVATLTKITPLSSVVTGNTSLVSAISNANIVPGSPLDVLLLTAREVPSGAFSRTNTLITDIAGGNRNVASNTPAVTNSNAKMATTAIKAMSAGTSNLGTKHLALNGNSGIELEEVNNLLALSSRKVAEEISAAKKETKLGYRSESNKNKIHRNMTMSDTMWVQGVFDRYLQTNSATNTGFGASTGGVVVGTNFATSNSEKASVYGGFSNTSLKYRLNKGKTIVNNYVVGLAMINDDVRSPVIYGANFGVARYKDKRTDTNNISMPTNSRHNAYNVGAHANLGKNYHEGDLLIKPSLGLELLSQFHKSYVETGGAISNSVNSKTIVTLDVKPGVEFTKLNKNRSTSLMKKVGLSYIYTANLSSNKNNRNLLAANLPFTTTSQITGRHALELDLSLVAKNKDADISLQYQGTLRNKGQNHMFGLGLEWKLNNDM